MPQLGAAAGSALFMFGLILGLLLADMGNRPARLRSDDRRLSLKLDLKATGPDLKVLKPLWNGSVLPGNVANQAFAIVQNPNYGYHVFALGDNGSIWHQFQTGPEVKGDDPAVPMSGWRVLTPNASLVFANDPAAAANADGHIELFVGQKEDSLDLWQMYQTDAKNPLAWSAPRGPSCACEDPDPSKCPWCLNCEERPECSQKYWCDGFPFTTSDMLLRLDPSDQKLKLYYRSFDGHLYRMEQKEPNKSDKWTMGAVDMGFFE